MKQIKIISVIIVVLTISATIFWACSKDNQDTTPQVFNDTPEWDIDIDKLMAETGIDIYAISELPALQKVSESVVLQSELAYQQALLSDKQISLSKKTPLTSEMTAEINRLFKEIEIAYANGNATGNFTKFYTLYEQHYAIFSSIDEFTTYTDENGLQMIEYEKKKYYLPVEQIMTQRTDAIAAVEVITTEVPQFPNLSVSTQRQVVAACISLNVTRSLNFMKTAYDPKKFEECVDVAYEQYYKTLASNKSDYTISVLGCVSTGPFIMFCGAYHYSKHQTANTNALETRNLKTEICRQKYLY